MQRIPSAPAYENREKMIDRIDKLITNLDRPDRFL